MNIEKHQNIFQKITYSKPFRFPIWFIKKIQYHRYSSQKKYTVNLRLGHQIQLVPTQRYLYNTLINRQYHDENIFLASKFLSKSNPVILDIGANIGLYTCAYAHYFKNLNPTIYAVEAVESNFNLLAENIKLNQFKNTFPFHIALGKENGFLEFLVPSENTVGNFAGNNITGPSEEEKQKMTTKKVQMTTLDELAIKHGIEKCDYMKVDIEGAELLLFQGGRDFIKKTRPVIQFEFNTHWLSQQKITFQSFHDYFKDLNYDFYFENKYKFIKIKQPEKYSVTTNLIDILIVPKEKSIS